MNTQQITTQASSRATVEAAIRHAWERGEMGEAIGLIVEHYQKPIQGYLLWTTCYNHALAGDAWDTFIDALLKSLSSFQWRCQCRTWCFKVAHSALSQVVRQWKKEGRLRAPTEGTAPGMGQGPGHARTSTRPWMGTTKKVHLQEVLETLEPDDRTLVDLRAFQGLEWKEIAWTLSDEADALDSRALTREANRLKQRYSRLIRYTLRPLLFPEGPASGGREDL